MATTALTPVQIDRSGTIVLPTPTIAAGAGAANAVTVPQAPGMFLIVKWTVTDTLNIVVPGGAPDGAGTSPLTKQITLTGGSGQVVIGPFPQSIYGSTVTAYGALATTLVAAAQLLPAYN
jgi:hypothetical protein